MQTNTPPFSPLNDALLVIGLREELMHEKNGDAYRMVIVPRNYVERLKAVEATNIYTNLKVRTISQDEINSRIIKLPIDTYNYDSFEMESIDESGEFAHTLLPQVHAYFKKLSMFDPSITKQQICFSPSSRLIIILPKLINNER